MRKFRKQPKELLDKYNEVSVQFTENVKNDQKNNKLTLDYKPEYVEGLSEQVVETIKKDDKLVLDSTAFINMNIMRHCKSEFVRKAYWEWS